MSRVEPIAQQIVRAYRAKIVSGQILPGTALPSITELREEFACSDTPVKAAIRELQLLGLVEGRPGIGNFVVGGGGG